MDNTEHKARKYKQWAPLIAAFLVSLGIVIHGVVLEKMWIAVPMLLIIGLDGGNNLPKPFEQAVIYGTPVVYTLLLTGAFFGSYRLLAFVFGKEKRSRP